MLTTNRTSNALSKAPVCVVHDNGERLVVQEGVYTPSDAEKIAFLSNVGAFVRQNPQAQKYYGSGVCNKVERTIEYIREAPSFSITIEAAEVVGGCVLKRAVQIGAIGGAAGGLGTAHMLFVGAPIGWGVGAAVGGGVGLVEGICKVVSTQSQKMDVWCANKDKPEMHSAFMKMCAASGYFDDFLTQVDENFASMPIIDPYGNRWEYSTLAQLLEKEVDVGEEGSNKKVMKKGVHPITREIISMKQCKVDFSYFSRLLTAIDSFMTVSAEQLKRSLTKEELVAFSDLTRYISARQQSMYDDFTAKINAERAANRLTIRQHGDATRALAHLIDPEPEQTN